MQSGNFNSSPPAMRPSMFTHVARPKPSMDRNRQSESKTYLGQAVCIYFGKDTHNTDCERALAPYGIQVRRFHTQESAVAGLSALSSYQPVIVVVECGVQLCIEVEQILELLKTSLFRKVLLLADTSTTPTEANVGSIPLFQNPCTPVKAFYLPKALPLLQWELADFLVEAQHFSNTVRKLPRFSSLNEREYRVARYVARGLPNKQICKLIDVSEKTIEKCRKELYEKLGVHSGPELASLVTFWNSYRWPDSIPFPTDNSPQA
ncbi:MAG: helix-turn-helix transcriptional regulator [Mariniblastus sp.]